MAERTARTRTSPGPGAGASSGRSSAWRLPANQRARGLPKRLPKGLPKGLPGAADGIAAHRVLDARGEEQVAAARLEERVRERDGVGEVADAEVAHGLYAGPEDLGRYAHGQAVHEPLAQERGY